MTCCVKILRVEGAAGNVELFDFAAMNQQQINDLCEALADCAVGADFDNLTPEQVIELAKAVDFAEMTDEQIADLCTRLDECNVAKGIEIVGNALNLLDGQGNVIAIAVLPNNAGGNGGAQINELTFEDGILTSTVDGIPAQIDLRGDPVVSVFGTTIGFLLPA